MGRKDSYLNEIIAIDLTPNFKISYYFSHIGYILCRHFD